MNGVAQVLAPPQARSFPAVEIRPASAADADAIHELISDHLDEGHLLPRDRGEILRHVDRFVVAVDEDDRIVACADLAPLSRTVAEVRSLVVSEDARGHGAGRRMLEELVQRAAGAGFEKLCAFTHAAGYFVHRGFSIVPHVWLGEKIETDCRSCTFFRRCGQYAVVLPLTRTHHSYVPLSSLHG